MICLIKPMKRSIALPKSSGNASNARKRGDKVVAVGWYEQAYARAEGPATRLQWGSSYVRALVDLAPGESARLRERFPGMRGQAVDPQREGRVTLEHGEAGNRGECRAPERVATKHHGLPVGRQLPGLVGTDEIERRQIARRARARLEMQQRGERIRRRRARRAHCGGLKRAVPLMPARSSSARSAMLPSTSTD